MAKKHKPSIILLDSISGTEALAMPDLKKLVPKLSYLLSHRSTLVLDNTAMATMYQPFRDLPFNPFGMRLIVVASVNKYYEFGFDRATAGIILTPLGYEGSLPESHMHMGANIPDVSVLSLPLPNRELLDKRLLRISRNALLLASRIDKIARGVGGALSYIVYPGLHTYPGYTWAKDMSFHGGVFTFVFKPKFQYSVYYEKFAERVMEVAKKREVDIVCGAGFGFDISRLYFTTRNAVKGVVPFLRMSAGTETISEVEALVDVFTSVISE